MRIAVLMMALIVSSAAVADEGLWTFDRIPTDAVKKVYGVDLTPTWLEHVRLSTLRLSNCSASFVSNEGLILTNHHCIESCLAEQSSKDANLLELGYSVAKRRDERRCSTQIADVLLDMQDVTAAIAQALKGLDYKAADAARKRLLTALEQTCEVASTHAKSGKLHCQVVTLYGGGQYVLYKYKRYHDVRLVFAPESNIAAFGGDPDNFQFPRWSLDFAILRAYEHDKPAVTPHHLRIDFNGPRPDQALFVAGNPGSTRRLETRAQLEVERDVVLPTTLLRTAELRGRYIQFGRTTLADEQLVEAPLDGLENGLKVRRKLLDALHDDALLARKSAEETELRAKTPLAGANGSDPWATIEAATQRERELYLPETFIEGGAGFNSILFRFARLLVRGGDERMKPNDARLREYTDAALPRIEQQLSAPIPVQSEVEVLTLSFSLQRMREWLGPDYPLVRRLLAADSPETLATRLVAETQLADPAVRQQLWQGGKSAVDASRDPLIVLVRSLDPAARAIRTQFEEEVEVPIQAAAERIIAERRQLHEGPMYPDATFTLRFNVGKVQGWMENGVPVDPITHLDRAFDRATGIPPFKLPDSWTRVRGQLDMHTPFCVSTDNDIVGGNSGSPLIDEEGHLVGVMFDGNIHSISGDYWFDASRNRAIALHPAIIKEALEKVYGNKELLAELSAP